MYGSDFEDNSDGESDEDFQSARASLHANEKGNFEVEELHKQLAKFAFSPKVSTFPSAENHLLILFVRPYRSRNLQFRHHSHPIHLSRPSLRILITTMGMKIPISQTAFTRPRRLQPGQSTCTITRVSSGFRRQSTCK